jgi:F0F1-type ATP synthase membrane subunit b/b'
VGDVIGELFSEVLHEISAHPQTFAIEVVQFVLLLLIVKVVAVGFGKRRGFVASMLAERRERVSVALTQAEDAPAALEEARRDAAAQVAAARSEAAGVLLAARADARSVLETTMAEADFQKDRMRAHAEETLATEFEEMHAEIRERLVDLVAGATRSILNESFAVSEQRALIQKAILSGIERIEVEQHSPRRERLVREGEQA